MTMAFDVVISVTLVYLYTFWYFWYSIGVIYFYYTASVLEDKFEYILNTSVTAFRGSVYNNDIRALDLSSE